MRNVRCRFSVRYPAGEGSDGKWRFVLASTGHPAGCIETEHPPLPEEAWGVLAA